MALLVASGIIADLGQLLAGLSGNALCAAAFYSAGLINLLIPSGGGQWAIQGPIIMQAASEAGVPTYKVLMARELVDVDSAVLGASTKGL